MADWSLTMNPGWNLKSIPINVTGGNTLGNVFGSTSPTIDRIIGEGKAAINTGSAWVGSLTSIDPERSYILYNSNDVDYELAISGAHAFSTITDYSLAINPGWNTIGFPYLDKSLPTDIAFDVTISGTTVEGNIINKIIGDSKAAIYNDVTNVWAGSFDLIKPFDGLMVYSPQASTVYTGLPWNDSPPTTDSKIKTNFSSSPSYIQNVVDSANLYTGSSMSSYWFITQTYTEGLATFEPNGADYLLLFTDGTFSKCCGVGDPSDWGGVDIGLQGQGYQADLIGTDGYPSPGDTNIRIVYFENSSGKFYDVQMFTTIISTSTFYPWEPEPIWFPFTSDDPLHVYSFDGLRIFTTGV